MVLIFVFALMQQWRFCVAIHLAVFASTSTNPASSTGGISHAAVICLPAGAAVLPVAHGAVVVPAVAVCSQKTTKSMKVSRKIARGVTYAGVAATSDAAKQNG